MKDWKACLRTCISNFKKNGGVLIKAKSKEDLPPPNWKNTFETLWPKRPVVPQWQALGEGDRKKIREHLEEKSDEQ